jgi:predicted metal-dependent HD superfamily phosphohydrolase
MEKCGSGQRGNDDMPPLNQQWHELLRTWYVDRIKSDRTFAKISAAYAGQGRFYHTLDHVQAVLGTVENLASCAKNINSVKLAGWLHDVIYDSNASDNEERSAEYAEQLCKELAIPEGQQVAALIRLTKTHDASEDVDAMVLLDADLSILGADQSEYQAYGENIRREYVWVPEPEYRRGRRQVLERFLGRPRIYHFLSHLEEPARRNLTAEIARLDRQGDGSVYHGASMPWKRSAAGAAVTNRWRSGFSRDGRAERFPRRDRGGNPPGGPLRLGQSGAGDPR